MIDKLSAALHFNEQALDLRHRRQEVLASNIANADTPNYKARDFDFSTALKSAVNKTNGAGSAGGMATTSAKHISGSMNNSKNIDMQYRTPAQSRLDGNTVDMDQERSRFADNSVRYQAAITLLDGQISSIRKAMQSE